MLPQMFPLPWIFFFVVITFSLLMLSLCFNNIYKSKEMKFSVKMKKTNMNLLW
uniref:ATP synthase F0 subunit 8 n=1 Tax=Sarcoptes scabiei TaxID=52283 RepID=A0A343ISS0_SARSC|nr:ATP synthase F0 subunit 8 [Sarcoptes scabiei]AST11106.1 ATP synthase F0 subunit 8 [Sarcoptes scabiei]AST11158.1 ATP synthase F0 subunit 8 [Sarcoptes scabiei]